MIDYCQSVLEKECRQGRASLDPIESECFLLYRFVCEYENGGLSGLLYNISPDWEYLVSLASVLRKKDDPTLASLIEEAHAVVASGPSDYQGTWSGWLDLADPKKKLPKIDDAISPKYSVIWRHLKGIIPKKG